MEKPSIENLEALVRGMELNIYQRALAKNELTRLKTYVYELEQSSITAVVQAKPEKVCDHQKTFKVVGGDVYLCPDCGKQFKNF
jgi:hypothetical protein